MALRPSLHLVPHYPPPQARAENSITYPTVRFISSLARNPQSLAGKIGAICFVLAAATSPSRWRAQKVEDKTFRTVNGIDIMIAFDLSYSMETPDMVLNRMPINRLVAAKHVITQFVDSRPDDRIGIVGFAGKTKSFCPLTLDHALVNGIIRDFHPRMIQADGTAIGSAIAAAATRLDDRKDTKSKIIILVTDGASNSGQISPLVAAENAPSWASRFIPSPWARKKAPWRTGWWCRANLTNPPCGK